MIEKQTILLFTNDRSFPACTLANYLSQCYNKEVIELGTGNTGYDELSRNPNLKSIEELLLKFDPVLVVFNYTMHTWRDRRKTQKLLEAFRELRVPYIAVRQDGEPIQTISKILVPVGFLPEEKEKAPWSSSFIKFCNSTITLLQPKDRGSRATKNVAFIIKVLESKKRIYSVIKGVTNSFKIEHEAIAKYEDNFDMVMISASRAYGLDDTFFGPKEFHVLKKARKPVLMINPRDDIYVLCGD